MQPSSDSLLYKTGGQTNGTNDYPKAMDLYLRVYKIYCKNFGSDNDRTEKALRYIRWLYRAMGGEIDAFEVWLYDKITLNCGE